ncbi:helix-turn-helix domain-containing protein [Streptomyces sp. TS71-3]|uniref:helix-turn-helix domain-containing protein n=1 Tax=Streptomyces sp. TS71-3 TaxID=2733862 RepID=UPI001B13B465|nr:helix-turn-helix domain-containing protein [Streptomyces sp. TS71-3]GHJ41170.1 AraC family transcriptional regulator [Streptomyces sp. TS71-3]
MGGETLFRTDDLPVEDRFDGFRDCITRAAFLTEADSAYARDFRGEIRLMRFGGIHLWPVAAHPMRLVRTSRLIRQSDPEVYHLTLSLSGTVDISQDGRQARHGPGHMYVVDSSRPSVCSISHLNALGLDIQRSLVPLSPRTVAPLLARPLSGGKSVGGLLAALLTQIASEGPHAPADATRLETVIVDLFSATLAHHLDAKDHLAPETRTRTLMLRIRAFIERHLHDSALDPATIAAAHHISLSYLHRLFQNEGITVSAWIRAQRLERARADLSDPQQHTVPVHHIAARWGFSHHAAFTRAFRSAFGTSPRDYRHRTQVST